MKIISIEELKRRGWRVEMRKVPRDYDPGYEWRYDLRAPDGTVTLTTDWETGAWRQCPDVPIDGLTDDYSWSADEEVASIDPHDAEAIEKHQDEHGPYGTHRIVLTTDDLDALKAGKCIVWGQHEYTNIIYYHDEQKGE